MSKHYTVALTTWHDSQEALRQVRETVFIREQHVPVELEWDGEDENCIHALALDANGDPIGTGRLLLDGHIGRMAVLPEWRDLGVGTSILMELLHYCKEHQLHPHLDAQTHATGFYRRLGFQEQGDEFMDAGIPHRHMILIDEILPRDQAE